nr:putative late blight resistance protein homolog R1A-10 isoform X2 [Nicotiana tomentosiformis]
MEMAEYVSLGKPPYQMRLMNFDKSWSLLYKKVFAKDNFPPEFEQLGKLIALKCRGLPLAIVVIAGLLSKIGKTLNEWKSIAENVSSVVSVDLDVHCIRVLALSYHHLPHHLKACFLYFAIFPEDKLIFVNEVMELWVVEGFLKIEETKNIEEVAEECLKDLIDRSLIFIHHLSFDGKIQCCGMHDVTQTRELCLREARNLKFVNVINGKNDQNPCAQSMHFSSKSRGRISIKDVNTEDIARCHCNEARSIFVFYRYLKPDLLRFKLVRVLDLASLTCLTFPSWILDLIHLKYLTFPSWIQAWIPSSVDIPPSISSLRYLQTFILKLGNPEASHHFILPSEILTRPQLRHLCFDWNYLYYVEPTEKSLVLKNLRCLSGWNPFYCTSSVFRLMPNLKKLHICGVHQDYRCRSNDTVFQDLCYLDQLQELKFQIKTVYKKEEIAHRVGHPSRGILKRFPPLLLSPSSIRCFSTKP